MHTFLLIGCHDLPNAGPVERRISIGDVVKLTQPARGRAKGPLIIAQLLGFVSCGRMAGSDQVRRLIGCDMDSVNSALNTLRNSVCSLTGMAMRSPTLLQEAYGHGLVLYAQIPEELFGNVEDPASHRVVPATAIDFSSNYQVLRSAEACSLMTTSPVTCSVPDTSLHVKFSLLCAHHHSLLAGDRG